MEAVTFPVGKFYSCYDPEALTHTEPEEAIEEYLDADLDPKMTVEEVVRCIRARPITVTAYNPKEISEKEIDHWSEAVVEHLGEMFHEEHGDPDGGCCDHFPGFADDLMRSTVGLIIKHSEVWSCEAVGKVTLSPDEIEQVMREYRPDWFREAAPVPETKPEE